MSSDTIESNATPEPETPKSRRKAAKRPKSAKKPALARKTRVKGTDRTNKKAGVIALMRRAKGATL